MAHAASEVDNQNTNEHILEYLRYYCDENNTFDFAVMLKGRWGAGKTYLIKSFLEARPQPVSGKKDLYVSLYGLTSTQEIDDALYRQLHPHLTSKAAAIGGDVTKAIFKRATSVDLALGLRSLFNLPKGHLLVFDDLERCSISIADALGYINNFVEHRECKAIILANEEEILEQPDLRYSQLKEKLIGQTLEVLSTAQSAIVQFLDVIRNEKVHLFLKNNIDDIILLHNRSCTNNLRLLRHSIRDFERLAICFSEKHWEDEEAMRLLFRVLLVLSFETRSGRLKSEQFDELKFSRVTRYLKAKKDEEESIIDELEKRYPEVNFDQTLISSGLLKQLLFNGHTDRDTIQSELDHSPYYAPPGCEPAWRTAWNYWHIDDDKYLEAVTKVEDQFEKREFLIPGEMLHVFGLRLSFSEIGAITNNKAKVVDQCKRYLDDIRDRKNIVNKYIDESEISHFKGWQGLRFSSGDTEEFKDIFNYYNTVIEAVAKDLLPDMGHDLLHIMKNDIDKYFRMLCPNNVEASVYYNVPILAAIPADDFVSEVLTLEIPSQNKVFDAFKSRYEHGPLQRELLDEMEWLMEVRRLFEEKAAISRPLLKYRILCLIKGNIDPFLR